MEKGAAGTGGRAAGGAATGVGGCGGESGGAVGVAGGGGSGVGWRQVPAELARWVLGEACTVEAGLRPLTTHHGRPQRRGVLAGPSDDRHDVMQQLPDGCELDLGTMAACAITDGGGAAGHLPPLPAADGFNDLLSHRGRRIEVEVDVDAVVRHRIRAGEKRPANTGHRGHSGSGRPTYRGPRPLGGGEAQAGGGGGFVHGPEGRPAAPHCLGPAANRVDVGVKSRIGGLVGRGGRGEKGEWKRICRGPPPPPPPPLPSAGPGAYGGRLLWPPPHTSRPWPLPCV